MGIWSKLFGGVPTKQWRGLQMSLDSLWEVDSTSDASLFFRALPLAISNPSANLYIEGTCDTKVNEFLKKHAATEITKVAVGTIWPRPDIHHVPLRAELLEELAALIDRESIAYLCLHLHVYDNDTMLLEWHDAWFNPILISSEVSEANVAQFATALQRSYSKYIPERRPRAGL